MGGCRGRRAAGHHDRPGPGHLADRPRRGGDGHPVTGRARGDRGRGRGDRGLPRGPDRRSCAARRGRHRPPEDRACGRSTDSLAAELARLRGEDVLNLACAGAGVAAGLRGPQLREGVTVDPQVGRLKQVRNLQWVVVAVGPNDLAWSDFLLYCYGLATCDDRLSDGEFESRLAGFARDVGALFTDLDTLPGARGWWSPCPTTRSRPGSTRPVPTCADRPAPRAWTRPSSTCSPSGTAVSTTC
ncbi:hypothetical protein [Pseudonocardia sp. ICBG601]|uniref:hypothetical protein n=1 Tax=Pseudonocardia sp. ICBG601 TaxID=2846759 RepID=UPI001CF666D4|nr:hypothetical protein [Pseudonocardia sp. ICBG601]